MKILLFSALFISSLISFSPAFAWTKIVDCNNRELVVDRGGNDESGRPTFQLVLKGRPLEYFVETGAVKKEEINSKGEFITWLNTYDGQLMGYRSQTSSSNGPLVYRTFWVSRSDADVTLRADLGNRLQGTRELANWLFRDCR